MPTLEVTKGWCIENHFCHPADVESALSLAPRIIQAELERVLDSWLWYGAIRWTLQKTREGITARLPLSNLGHPVQDPCDQDPSALRTRLQGYSGLFSPRELDGLIDEIRVRKGVVDALSVRDQIETGVHGKEIFKEVITLALNSAIGQASTDAWRNSIAGKWKGLWPEYLVAFANRLVT